MVPSSPINGLASTGTGSARRQRSCPRGVSASSEMSDMNTSAGSPARGGSGRREFRAYDPVAGRELEPPFQSATEAEVDAAAQAAARAFPSYVALPAGERAAFIRRIADELESRKDALVERGVSETGLPVGRLQGELGRTTGQLRMFADLIERPEWLDARIDAGDPQRHPPKPDVRSLRRGVGPVVVFGASNFPLAFSVAGGDTASALAAGCPVICKAHPSHPGTSRLAGEAILAAAAATGMPTGVFALLFDDGHEVGGALVRHPKIKAVGFTGSRTGGEALMRIAAERPEPIPVYAEMGSVNPVFVLPEAAAARGREIAEGLHASFTLGVGQFCTNPGVTLVPVGAAGDALRDELVTLTSATAPGSMLNPGICKAYGQGLERLRATGATRLAEGGAGPTNGDADSPATTGVASVWETELATVRQQPELLVEVFGPSTLLIRYDDPAELPAFADAMEGQLTATMIGEPTELAVQQQLVASLADRAGRLIVNQFPTGVEVTPAMVHGGPFPATSDGRSTSVGTHAIDRFTRLVAYQNFPQALLPTELRDA